MGQPNNLGCGLPTVFAYDGATGGRLWSDSAPSWSDQLGAALAPLADVASDGIPEVLAGAPQDPDIGGGPCNDSSPAEWMDSD